MTLGRKLITLGYCRIRVWLSRCGRVAHKKQILEICHRFPAILAAWETMERPSRVCFYIGPDVILTITGDHSGRIG